MRPKAAISCCLRSRISPVLIIRISVVISGCLWYNKAYCHVYFFTRERCFLLNSVADVWDNVLSQLKGELSETTIATWFDELEAVDIQGNTFILH